LNLVANYTEVIPERESATGARAQQARKTPLDFHGLNQDRAKGLHIIRAIEYLSPRGRSRLTVRNSKQFKHLCHTFEAEKIV
jgi:hypothetical protein